MDLLRFTVHYGMHFLVPGLIAYVFFGAQWLRVWGIFILTMLIDLDHLLATPIFDPTRCSIGFHPMHSWLAIGAYSMLTLFKRYRIIGIALLFHILTDLIDCYII